MSKRSRLYAILIDRQRLIGSDEWHFLRGTLPADRFAALCKKWGVK